MSAKLWLTSLGCLFSLGVASAQYPYGPDARVRRASMQETLPAPKAADKSADDKPAPAAAPGQYVPPPQMYAPPYSPVGCGTCAQGHCDTGCAKPCHGKGCLQKLREWLFYKPCKTCTYPVGGASQVPDPYLYVRCREGHLAPTGRPDCSTCYDRCGEKCASPSCGAGTCAAPACAPAYRQPTLPCPPAACAPAACPPAACAPCDPCAPGAVGVPTARQPVKAGSPYAAPLPESYTPILQTSARQPVVPAYTKRSAYPAPAVQTAGYLEPAKRK